MNILILFGILLLNLGISYWNARIVGLAWVEAKYGGIWMRLLTWAGAIQSALGFTWSYLTILGLIAGALGYLTAEQLDVLFSLGYLVVVPGILMSGLVIWLDSLARAVRTRQFSDIAVGGYNTFAQAYNTYHAIRGVGPAFEKVLEFFKSDSGDSDDDGKGAAGMLIILLVLIALLGGVITTWVLINHYAAQEDMPNPDTRRFSRR